MFQNDHKTDMARFSEETTLREILDDKDGKKILRQTIPLAILHPRLSEALHMTVREIITDEIGTIAGIPNSKIKEAFGKLMSLE